MSVSELGSSESDDGNGGGLKGSGTSNFDEVLGIWGLDASSPLGLECGDWGAIAVGLIVFLVDDTIFGIASGDGSESFSVDGIRNLLNSISAISLVCLSKLVVIISFDILCGNSCIVLIRAFSRVFAIADGVQCSLRVEFF